MYASRRGQSIPMLALLYLGQHNPSSKAGFYAASPCGREILGPSRFGWKLPPFSSFEFFHYTGRSFREIVRQQWNFSPPETVSEVQDYQVELADVTVLELSITPDISGGTARATLKSLRLS